MALRFNWKALWTSEELLPSVKRRMTHFLEQHVYWRDRLEWVKSKPEGEAKDAAITDCWERINYYETEAERCRRWSRFLEERPGIKVELDPDDVSYFNV